MKRRQDRQNKEEEKNNKEKDYGRLRSANKNERLTQKEEKGKGRLN